MNEIEKSKIDQLNGIHDEIMTAMKTTVQKAVEAGGILKEIKESLPHGEFTGWVENNVTFDIRTAQRYMKAHNNRALLKNDSVSFLRDLTGDDGRSKQRPPDPIAAMFSWCPKVRVSCNGMEIIEPITADEWAQLLETAKLLNEDRKARIVGALLNYGLGDGAPASIYTEGTYTITLYCGQHGIQDREVHVLLLPIEDIRVDESIYSRTTTGVNWSTVKQYADTLAHLPPIELDNDSTLIDGRMRLEAFKLRGAKCIPAFYVGEHDIDGLEMPDRKTALRALGVMRNSAGGLRFTSKEWERFKRTEQFRREYPESANRITTSPAMRR